MSQLPRCAVLLAAYEGERWLGEQVDSVLAQQGVAVTLFVSVDPSRDGTQAWCEARARSDARVVLLPPAGPFGGAARNFYRLLRDVPLEPFDYMAWCDQDDIWHPDKLARAHAACLEHAAAAYSSNVTAFWPDGREVLLHKAQPQTRWDHFFEAAGPGCTYVFRRDLALVLQSTVCARWDQMQGVGLHDWFAYALARAQGWRWFIDPAPGLRYRQHAHNQVGANVGWQGFARRARRILGGWGLAQARLIVRILDLQQDPFVRHWTGGGRRACLYLALRAHHCRRRPQDRVWFALSMLAQAIWNK